MFYAFMMININMNIIIHINPNININLNSFINKLLNNFKMNNDFFLITYYLHEYYGKYEHLL